MKYFKFLFMLQLLTVANIASAGMTVEIYLKLQRYEEGTDQASQIAKNGRMTYLVGLSDAFSFIAAANNNTLNFQGKSVICLPSPDVLTAEVLSSSVGRIIGTSSSPTAKAAEWKDILVSQAAFLGLAQTFPCKKNE